MTPRETSGRDTIARYQAQFRAAAYECLSILTRKTIDRVYCDYHDDYVSREPNGDKRLYHFFQVKTKGKRNHQWNRLDLFGIPKKKKVEPAKVVESYIAMIGLAEIDLNRDVGNAPTILYLFGADGHSLDGSLSVWDQAFLKSLYGTPQESLFQLSQLTAEAMRVIAP